MVGVARRLSDLGRRWVEGRGDHPGERRFRRALLGDEPEAGTDIGLREIGAHPVKGLIHELQEASFNEETLRQVEDLTAFLRRENVQVRLHTRGFLHAKCYLFYSGGGFEHFHPITAIVGSSNFTRAGLSSNKELNLVHRANLETSEIALELVKGFMGNEERQQLKVIGERERRLAANIPGVLAINELTDWYERQWDQCLQVWAQGVHTLPDIHEGSL